MVGEETFHPDTRALLGYGRALASGEPAPKKGAADHVLERLMVIENAVDGRLPVRTFGAELIDVFGRDLRDHDLARFFLAPDLKFMRLLIDACAEAGEPGIARVTAETAKGGQLGAEILVTPLKLDAQLGARFLVLFQPLGGQVFLRGDPILRLRVGSLHPPPARAPANVRLVVIND